LAQELFQRLFLCVLPSKSASFLNINHAQSNFAFMLGMCV